MKTNSFSANAVGGRGGLFDSAAQTIKDALLAYFQHQRNTRQDERQLKRDERMYERDQTNQAVELARRTGVRPDASQLGWTSPDRINPLLDASVRKYTQDEEQAGQARAMAELQQRAQRLKLAQDMGPEGLPPGASEAEIIAAQRGAQERALALKRQGVSDQLNTVRLKQEQDQAVYNSVPVRAIRGVGQWLGDTVQEGVKAIGRRKEQTVPGMNGAQIMLRDLSLAEQTGQPYMGENNTVVPVEKIPAFRAALQQWMAQQGGQGGMPPQPGAAPVNPNAGKRRVVTRGQDGSLSISYEGQPGVDTSAPAGQPRAWTQDKELDFWAGYEAEKIKGGTGQAAMRQWNGGNPTFSATEMSYMKTLPQSEQVALANAMRSQDYKIRAIASLKLHDDANAWSSTQGK